MINYKKDVCSIPNGAKMGYNSILKLKFHGKGNQKGKRKRKVCKKD